MTNDLFTDASNNDQTVEVKLEDLVGDGKKYSTAEDLAKAYGHAQKFIDQLKAEATETRNELQTRISLEEAIAKLGKPDSNASNQGNQPSANGSESKVENLTKEDITRLTKEIISSETTKAKQERNVQEVKTQLESAWGKGYVAKLKEAALDLGVTEQFLADLAANNPKVFLRTVGADAPTKQTGTTNLFSPPQSNQRTALPGQTTVDGVHNKAYWDQVRKSDPKFYFSDQATIQRHKDATKLGEAFFR